MGRGAGLGREEGAVHGEALRLQKEQELKVQKLAQAKQSFEAYAAELIQTCACKSLGT